MKIMATKFGYKRDAVRVKAMKVDGNCLPDTRKFSIDPQITTHEVLRSILSKAFELKQEFTIFYRVLDDYDQETYLPLLSDWDLDAAFVSAAEPCLCLRIELKLFDEVGEEWDTGSNSFSWITERKIPLRLQGLIMNHVEKTVNMVRGALNFIEDIQPAQEVTCLPPREPLTDSEFRFYLDPIGQLIRPEEFKHAIYLGGVEPSLRKVVWKHLLNVYPAGLSGKQRIEYMKRKSYEYEILKNSWKNVKNDEQLKEDLVYVTGMVKKDVLRTDRQHNFYAGSDDNQNIVSLFNILTTYALNHPSVSYCQGMSDLASPLLVTMGNEAHAYICFCSLMRRLSSNFLIDGIMMTQRFQHLSDGLFYYDPTFYAYLKAHQADDLLFCYRWLLLEMKREFAFEDALRMLEVMWSSLPPTNPPDDLPLYEVRFCSNSQFLPPPSPSPRETPYTKVCALRRQTSSGKVLMVNRSLDESVIARRRLLSGFAGKPKKFSSLDESSFLKDRCTSLKNIPGETSEPTTSSTTSVYSYSSSTDSDSSKSFPTLERNDRHGEVKADAKKECEPSLPEVPAASNRIVKNLNEFLTLDRKSSLRRKELNEMPFRASKNDENNDGDENSNSSPDDSSEYHPMTTSMTQKLREDFDNLEKQAFDIRLDDDVSRNNGEEVFIWENPLQEEAVSELAAELKKSSINHDESVRRSVNGSGSNNEKFQCNMIESRDSITLPGPKDFGGGNPFLMFLCISVLCQHRDPVMKSGMDYNEIAMHFDKMVRKHNVTRVLNQARIMYAAYLKQHKENFLNV